MENLVDWLLESPTPSIRYLTFRNLLGYAENHSDVQAACAAISTTGAIPQILSHQTPAGHWESDSRMYGQKYVGTHWSMVLLLELAADPNDLGVRRGAEFMLEASAHNPMLVDQFDESVPSPEVFGFNCFWGNVLRYAAYCGMSDDPRIAPIVDYIARNISAGACKCHINDYLPCAWGAARSLWGLAALPNRSEAVNEALRAGVGFLLDANYPLAEGRYPTRGTVHKLWGTLNFPLFYQTDVLFVLRLLGELDVLAEPGAQQALDWLEAQRQPDGRWRGNNPFSARTWKVSGDRQDIHRWVSLHAATVLKQAGRWN